MQIWRRWSNRSSATKLKRWCAAPRSRDYRGLAPLYTARTGFRPLFNAGFRQKLLNDQGEDTPAMLDKTYRPGEVEARLYAEWEKSGAFAADPSSDRPPYVIMMPPPNVTGSLHIGHALTFTIQDILIRYHRMAGKDALWQPGMDHAGIATQMVVERKLAEQKLTRHSLGRDRFLEKVWEWKAASGGTITKQLRRLGASPDWPRERFTMDEGLSRAVGKVFVTLHKQGLIYKDKRLVNWDPKLHTAISDLEVQQVEKKGHLWHIRYPIEGQDGRFVVVATTRPETMLGDSGIAVHPDDERYTSLVGKHAILPLVGRRLPIVADDYADPEAGSGAVKMTPAHDFNDFEVGRRHDLEKINIFDANACLTDAVPEKYRGLDRFAARKAVVADLEAAGLIERIEDIVHTVPHGDRSGVPIEPWLTDQWYVDAAALAKPAIAAVEQGRIQFVPKQWENTYFEWMRNIQPWCVSRQIWWGHQIPAWYGPDGTVFVEETETAAAQAARGHYSKDVELHRDEDVLDTWFSSALWPFSTIGWPEKTPELERYYPGDVLVTGFDIIFFWVARMIMMGMHFMDEVPFHTVYIHALVRDAHGQKMSKSKNNIIDPLEVIDRYGCDALRFTLAAMAAPGRDIMLAESRLVGYRNFVTKLWNASRFCEMNGAALDPSFDPAACTQQVNRWAIGKVAQLGRTLDKVLTAYRFDDAANALYHFTWHDFCDWYIEFSKPIITGSNAEAAAETRAAVAWTLSQILHLLHPIMPFVTEELWSNLGGAGAGRLITADWPVYGDDLIDTGAAEEMDWVIRLVSDIRAVRAEMNVPAAARVPLLLKDATPDARTRLKTHGEIVTRLARLDTIGHTDDAVPAGAVQLVLDGATAILPLGGVIDLAREQERLQREIGKIEGDISKAEKKLGNEAFISKAPPEVIAIQKERLEEGLALRAKLTAALTRLSG
jgi:valyl-tRNA synthetase